MPVITLDYTNTKIDDTHVIESTPDSIYGGTSYLQAGVTSGKKQRALLRFDLWHIPNNAIINSATLTLTSGNTNAGTVNAHIVTENWDAATATWNMQPAYEQETKATIAFPGSVPTKINADIRSIVQEWINGKPNYGLLLENDNATLLCQVYSSDNSSASDRPILTIDYSIPETGKKQVELKAQKTHSVNTAYHNISLTDVISGTGDIGDTLIAYINTSYSVTDLIIPDGWTLVTTRAYSASSNNITYVLSRRIDGTEGPLILKRSSNAMFSVGVIIARYRNLKNIKILEGYTFSNTSPNYTLTGVPTNSLLTIMVAHNGSIGISKYPLGFRATNLGTTGGMSVAIVDTYNYEKSSYTTSETRIDYSSSVAGVYQAFALEPITNQAPNIDGEDENLGSFSAPLQKEYTVTDNENDAVTIVEKLDGATIGTKNISGANTLDLTAQWDSLSFGKHSVTIEVNDAYDPTRKVVRTWTFLKILAFDADLISVVKSVQNLQPHIQTIKQKLVDKVGGSVSDTFERIIDGAELGKKYASGTVTSSSTTLAFQYAVSTSTNTAYQVTVTDLPFRPKRILLYGASSANRSVTEYSEGTDSHYPRTAKISWYDADSYAGTNYNFKGDVSPASVADTSFTLPVLGGNTLYTWEIYGE